MRRLADRFAHEAATCADVQHLKALLADATTELGFDFFALLHHASLTRKGGGHVRIDNYPASWVEEIVAAGLAAHDPVHRASGQTNIGFSWSEVDTIITLDDRHREIFGRSRTFGLGDGFTVPVNVPGEPSGSCSFAVADGREIPRQKLSSAELIGAHAFRAARRIAGGRYARSRPHLSRRQVQCLALIARGKSDWEIGQILGISPETARQYVKRARAAYDVVTRTQLVVLGLRDDWLTFDEATTNG